MLLCSVAGAGVPQVQVSPERIEVQEGSTVRLYCRAAGSPAATITWEKQGGSLPPQVKLEEVPRICQVEEGTLDMNITRRSFHLFASAFLPLLSL